MYTSKYLLTSSMFDGEMTFEYDKDGNLSCFTCTAQFNDEQRNWLRTRFPISISDMTLFINGSKTTTVRLLAADLSFSHFWDTYAYKIGDKRRAEKLYNELSESDKLRALETIAPYNYYLATRPNMEKLYPETYLKQRRFESDFKAMSKSTAKA